MAAVLQVDIWSDIACPWCYVGKRRFEAALADYPARAQVHVVWRSFQLDPSAPRVQPEQCYAERLAAKYGTSPAQAQALIERMVQTAASDGIAMDFERIQPGNTFDAHRLLHWAKARGAQDALEERLFRAYLCEGQAIGDADVLMRLAGEVGLDLDEARGVLDTDIYDAEVRADIARARELGISGVPFFVIGGRYGVSGAQPAELLRAALEQAAAELAPTAADGDICGPSGCEPARS
jgi:predicted DsbA family dithiol-disulfide isomerase